MKAVYVLRHEHKIQILCRVLRVNRSSYYKHFNRISSPRELENQQIRCEILSIHSKYQKRLGVLKIGQKLQDDYGRKISPGRVRRLIRSMNLPRIPAASPRFRCKKDDHTRENVLKQQFNPDRPNAVWVSDITYVRTAGRWGYVCVILDLFARKLIAWQVSQRIDAALAIATLEKAMESRGYPQRVVFHTDRGVQYTSADFQRAIDLYECVPSFSAKGHPYDNAVAESFFRHLKREELNRKSFDTLADLKLAMSAYERFYNEHRPHLANLNLTPTRKEEQFVPEPDNSCPPS